MSLLIGLVVSLVVWIYTMGARTGARLGYYFPK